MQDSVSALPYPTCDVERDQSKRQVIPAAYVKALCEVVQDGMPRRSDEFMRQFDTVLARQKQTQYCEVEATSPSFVRMMNRLFGHQ